MLFTWCTLGGEELDLNTRVTAALDAWFALIPCAELTHTYAGACDDATPVDLRVVAGDPDNMLADGILMVADPSGGTTTITLNDVTFASNADVAAGTCVDTFNLDLLLAHELGSWLGLPNTCDEGEACTDPSDQTAVMYWAIGPCEARSVNAADEALMWDVYGDSPGCEGETGPGDDTGAADDTGTPDDDTGGVSPISDEDEEGETSCGCTSGGGAAGVGAVLLALATLTRRRRR